MMFYHKLLQYFSTALDCRMKDHSVAVRLINNAVYNSPMFLKSNILKFYDLVDVYTSRFMYEVKHNKMSQFLQLMFTQRESNYNLRGICLFNRAGVANMWLLSRMRLLAKMNAALWFLSYFVYTVALFLVSFFLLSLMLLLT